MRAVLADAAELWLNELGELASEEEGKGEEAAAVSHELRNSGEDWAGAVLALRRGQEEILEHLLLEVR